MGIEIKSRTYISIQHIQSAACFTRLAYQMEESHDGIYSQDFFTQHRAYVTSAIFTAVAFLEASINELFCDSVDQTTVAHDRIFKQLDSKTIKLFSSHWSRGIPRTAKYSIIEKYQIALELAEKELFKKGQSPCQDVHFLVQLRNALIHYEPEWVVGYSEFNENIKEHTLESALKARFKINKATGAGNPYYPDQLLGHGCAEWGTINSIKFVDDFCSRLGVNSRFDHVRGNLSTK